MFLFLSQAKMNSNPLSLTIFFNDVEGGVVADVVLHNTAEKTANTQ